MSVAVIGQFGVPPRPALTQKKASADAWVQYIPKETAKARTRIRWSLEWDPDFTTMWNLINNGPGPVGNLQFAVRHGKNSIAITVLNEMDCEVPLCLEFGGPERAYGQILILKWDDDSGTNHGYQIPVPPDLLWPSPGVAQRWHRGCHNLVEESPESLGVPDGQRRLSCRSQGTAEDTGSFSTQLWRRPRTRFEQNHFLCWDHGRADSAQHRLH